MFEYITWIYIGSGLFNILLIARYTAVKKDREHFKRMFSAPYSVNTYLVLWVFFPVLNTALAILGLSMELRMHYRIFKMKIIGWRARRLVKFETKLYVKIARSQAKRVELETLLRRS